MESANVRVQNTFHREITLYVVQTVATEQLQRQTPQKHGCFRYITVNSLHKGSISLVRNCWNHDIPQSEEGWLRLWMLLIIWLGTLGPTLPLVQFLPKVRFRKSWWLALHMNMSLTISSSYIARQNPVFILVQQHMKKLLYKDKRWTYQSLNHRTGHSWSFKIS